MRRLLLPFILFLMVVSIYAEVVEVTATGIGSIIAGDVAKAKEDALSAALRSAVEQVVGVYISSETMTENFMVVEDRILSKASGYVKKYEVLEEKPIKADNSYEVKVKAWVATERLEADIDELIQMLRSRNYPRMVVFVEGDAGLVDVVREKIEEVLRGKGMQVVVGEAKDISGIVGADEKVRKAVMESTGGEIAVVAKVSAQELESGDMGGMLGGMHSCKATVVLRAFNLDNGKLIATSEAQGTALHIDVQVAKQKSAGKAAESASGKLMENVIDVWRAEEQEGRLIEVDVDGLQTLEELKLFVNDFQFTIRGVSGVFTHRFSPGSGTLLEVQVKQDAGDLARELSNKGLPHFEVKVLSQNHGKLELYVRVKQ